MLKELLTELGLSQDQIDKICTAHEAALSTAREGYIPQNEHDEVCRERDGLATTLGERDTQLASLQESAGNSEEIETLRGELDAAILKNETDSRVAPKI